MIAQQIELHPAAKIFPMMADDQFQAFVEDVREHGIRESIVFYDGKLIDGRNRLKAMQSLGIDHTYHACEIDVSDDFDAVAYVLSCNLHRRHLSESQRGMIAARAKKAFVDEASERKKSTQVKDGKPPVKDNCPSPRKGQSRDKAGEALKVSGKTVDRATKVLESGNEEVIAAVDNDEMSLNAAVNVVSPPKARKPKPESFAAIRSYFEASSAEDRIAVLAFVETCKSEGVAGDKLTMLHSLWIDWCS